MSDKIRKIEAIYERLYQISLQISELIERELYSELVTYLTKKEELLEESGKLIESVKDCDINTDNLKIIVQKYQIQEQKNLTDLSKIKMSIKEELQKTAQNARLVGAYRQNKESVHGNILDFSE